MFLKSFLVLWAFCSVLAVVVGFYLWDKLSHVQELVARQSADTSLASLEAKSLAKESLDLTRDTAAKLALTQNKLSEVVLQRAQLDALMQSLSRSRDENLIEDIDASLRLAQQQALLTGSLQPLLSALKASEERLAKISQPRLSGVQRAIAKDIDRVKSSSLADTPNLLIQLDEMIRLMDELPLSNDVLKSKESGSSSGSSSALSLGTSSAQTPGPGHKEGSQVPAQDVSLSWAQRITQGWWQKAFASVWLELKGLLRVSQIDHPQGVLISPEQAFFVRENLKLRLLNARMALLARQVDTAKADTAVVQKEINQYFDLHQKNTAVAIALLQSIQVSLKQLQLPTLSESLTALAQAQAGH
jgi:uroporphyrin-3 C-methyltransferase